MNRLKELRKKSNFTQKEIANIIGIAQNTYSCWENGKIRIDNASLQKLADYFNVSVDYLLGRDDIKKAPTEVTDKKIGDLEQVFRERGITPEKFDALPENKKQLLFDLITDMIESNGQK